MPTTLEEMIIQDILNSKILWFSETMTNFAEMIKFILKREDAWLSIAKDKCLDEIAGRTTERYFMRMFTKIPKSYLFLPALSAEE